MITAITREQLEQVKDLAEDKDVAVFIAMAHELVTAHLADAGYNDTRLTFIEQWLAAHFYSIWERKTYSESADGISATYESKIGLFLKLTHEGQQAMFWDSEGILAAIDDKMQSGGKANVNITFIGNTGC
jgi:hypothetical protein